MTALRRLVLARRDAIRLAVMGGALLLLVVLLTLRSVSLGPSRVAYGAVTGLLSAETDVGTLPGVWVQVGKAHVRVRLGRGHGCVIGSRIELLEQRTLLGRRYVVGAGGCRANR